MKKMKKLTSLLLVLVMSLALAVPAFAASIYKKSLVDTLYSDSYQFNVWTEFSYNGYEYMASAYSDAIYGTPSSGYVKVTAQLCNSSGKVLKQKKGTGSGALVFATTDGIGDPSAYAAKGLVSYDSKTDQEIPGVTMYGAAFSRSRAFQASLGKANGYSVNSRGETYGSTMLAEVVGYEPDLISAVGVDGVEGYIRYEDVCPDTYRIGEIPLYDQEGIVIGTFIND